MEADKKIWALSLVKFSRLSLADVDTVSLDSAPSLDSIADSSAGAINFAFCPSAGDAYIIFYVSGAIGRSVVHSTKCDTYHEWPRPAASYPSAGEVVGNNIYIQINLYSRKIVYNESEALAQGD